MDELRTANVILREYGPLPVGFSYTIRSGYTAFVGPNNAGKSSLLQLVFRTLVGDAEFGHQRVALVLPDRAYVSTSIETGGRSLEHYNQDLQNSLTNLPLQFMQEGGPQRAQLTRVLLHENLYRQLTCMNELLPRFGLHALDVGSGGTVEFEKLAVHVQGSGLRSILPILAAVTNPAISALLVDEPELSLEPRLQKELRDVLVETAEAKSVVMVATHSHLMLNRQEVASTQVVTGGAAVEVETLSELEQLFDLTFDLLGASTEDLFFPKNYLIVEGASDEVIVARALELLGDRGRAIKVLAAGGIGEIAPRAIAVERALVPLVVRDSPYAQRVVALVDSPQDSEARTVERIRTTLGDRLFVLDLPSIEAYMPSSVYAAAGRERDSDLAALESLAGDRDGRNALKREISNALAEAMTVEALDALPIIRAAIERASAD